ncbi:S-formylglutathione hydrolase [Aquabacterium sp. A7-Y]|uniref:S-formylglutathione hydrolase n=1 Tax=Aquabacterium sp. A7-Y TaxID=1349605 RepID=UPI00223D6968|nr:S-formylglutathione hydrolase [Aquabacterium sp. A7-Y]MCW7539794.1 S-formylglutathione hydrolase [Aquabacterium sp. A7-Y]
MAPELLSAHACFGGHQSFWRHDSARIGLPMRFGIYLPPQTASGPVPVLFYLAGLTCTEETFATKAGAQRWAAELGLALVTPDTSPREAGAEGESATWDFGVGAGFYLDAMRSPWRKHWRMESYIADELLSLVAEHFAVDVHRAGIFGHSMGGHGALTLALRHPGLFASVSAFAPIAAPIRSPWGQKAFEGYLGEDRRAWTSHDATELMARQPEAPYPGGILIDQGLDDNFLDEQLHPAAFEAACDQVGQPLTLRRHAGYDHGYYFIASFVEDHLRFHAAQLTRRL